MDGAHGADEVRQRGLLREVAAGADLERLDQGSVVLLVGQHDHPAVGEVLPDERGAADAVVRARRDVDDGDVGRRPLGLVDRVHHVAGVGDDPEIGLALEDDAHGAREQPMLVREQDGDRTFGSRVALRLHLPPPSFR